MTTNWLDLTLPEYCCVNCSNTDSPCDLCKEQKEQLKSQILTHLEEAMLRVVGDNEVDETGMQATTAWGIRINDRNNLRSEIRQRIQQEIARLRGEM